MFAVWYLLFIDKFYILLVPISIFRSNITYTCINVEKRWKESRKRIWSEEKISRCWLWRPARQRATWSYKMRIHCGALMCDKKRGFSVMNLLVCRMLALRHNPPGRRVYPALCVSLIAFPKKKIFISAGNSTLFSHESWVVWYYTYQSKHYRTRRDSKALSTRLLHAVGLESYIWSRRENFKISRPLGTCPSRQQRHGTYIATMDEKSYVNVD